jgi:hypothetical protein
LSGPWERYQEAETGPWAKYGPSEQARVAAERGPDPTEGMTTGEKVRAGIGKAFYDVARGAGQLVGLVSADDIRESRRLDQPLLESGMTSAPPIEGGRLGVHRAERPRRTAMGPGGGGVAIGNIAIAAPLALAPGANTVLGAGLYGAGYGAIQPAESGMERLENITQSGLGSAGITATARALPASYKATVSPFTKGGQERISLDTISRFAKDPNALKNASITELVPGSKPTLAEVTGDPGIAQLQRAAQAASPETASLLAESKTTRLEARKNALLSVAGQAGEKEAMEAVRDSAAQRLYSKAWKTPIDTKVAKSLQPEVKELLARPSIREAQKQALNLAKEEGEVLTQKDLNGGSVKGLHYTKKALDDQISAAKRAGNDNEARLLMGTRDKFLDVVDELSPAYKKARAEYQTASRPINRMEIGRYLYDKLIPALTDLGAERATPAAFARALKEGDEMAKRATGFKGAKLRDILTTDEVKLLVSLGADLGREAKALEMGRVPGSPTAQYLSGRNALRQMMGPLGLPQSWAEKLFADTIAGRAISAAAAPAENALQAKLGQFLADPAQAQAAASKFAKRDAKLMPLSEVGRYALPPLSVGGSAYAAQQD